MSWIIGILTVILVFDCLLLGLLVLVQLPKKEAGLGTAFGGGATDALFGAGTGNALTKMTKYAVAVFFMLTLTLSMLRAHQTKSKRDSFGQAVREAQPVITPASPTNEVTVGGAPTNAPATTATGTN